MAAPRPRPQVMRLTDAAAERIKAVMAKAERPIAAVRVGVKNGGCAGMSYTMEYAEKINPLDEVIEDKGVRILIDPKAGDCSCSAPRWTTGSKNCPRNSCSTIRTRPRPAAAANRCSSSRPPARPVPRRNRKVFLHSSFRVAAKAANPWLIAMRATPRPILSTFACRRWLANRSPPLKGSVCRTTTLAVLARMLAALPTDGADPIGQP